jgi:hypothetical protein
MWLIASLLLATAGTPQQFLQGIYKQYVKHGHAAKMETRADLEKLFTPELVKLLLDDRVAAQKRGDEVDLDYDPFVNAQDWNIARYEIAVEGTKATVKLIEPKGATSEVKLDLQETPAGWRVADIHGGPEDSLVAFLKKAIANAY